MKKLFFVRHGLSEANVKKFFAGRSETPLTGEGHLQAKIAGKKIRDTGHMFDLIISSPLSRARHTAEYIAEAVDYSPTMIEYSDLFIERSWGVLEGTSVDDFKDNYPIEAIEKVEGVETLVEMELRAQKALAYLNAKVEDNILVVSHGSFGRALVRVVNGQHYMHEYSKEAITIGNCEIIELI